MPTSFSCQRSSVPVNCFRSERLRARRSAVPVWSRRSEKSVQTIKNPATSAGRIRPSLQASFPRAFGRMCSKLGFFLPGICNQSHLWMSRQARSVSRQAPNQGSTNFTPVYQNSKSRQVAFTIFLGAAPVKFTFSVDKTPVYVCLA